MTISETIAALETELDEAAFGLEHANDEAERVVIGEYVAELRAKLDSARAESERRRGRRNWRRVSARIREAAREMSVSSSMDWRARGNLKITLIDRVYRAESRALLGCGCDVSDEADALRAFISEAEQSAGKWYLDRLDHMANRRARPTGMEKSFMDELRIHGCGNGPMG